jgi:hypothetical protein
MKRSTEETALLVATLLKRSGKRRARVSEKTIRLLSKRRTLRDSFKGMLRGALDDLDIHLIQLNSGGFAIIEVSALEGAPPITAVNFLADELKNLKKGSGESVFDKLRNELEADEAGDGDE